MHQAADGKRRWPHVGFADSGLPDVAFEDGELGGLDRRLDTVAKTVAEQQFVVPRMLVGERQHAGAGVQHAGRLRQRRYELAVSDLAYAAQDRRAVLEMGVDAGGRRPGATRHVGLDLGATNLKWVVLEDAEDGWVVIASHQVPTRVSAEEAHVPDDVTGQLAEVARAAIDS